MGEDETAREDALLAEGKPYGLVTNHAGPFRAHCLDCEWRIEVAEYLERGERVGGHRLATGHSVRMSEAPADKSTPGPQ